MKKNNSRYQEDNEDDLKYNNIEGNEFFEEN